jgi:hypothetical protein
MLQLIIISDEARFNQREIVVKKCYPRADVLRDCRAFAELEMHAQDTVLQRLGWDCPCNVVVEP